MTEGKGTPSGEEKGSDSRPPWWKRLWAWTEIGEKKLWDWLELLSALAIPVVLTVVGLLYTAQQEDRQQEIEEQRAQDLALQAYLDQMGTLVLEDLDDPKVQTLMRARTLTILERLDPSRKTEIIQFLAEAHLVDSEGKRDPVIDLTEANLRRVELVGANLGGADLQEVTLFEADLYRADLHEVTLFKAVLHGAYLSEANLGGANLSNADLRTPRSGPNLRNVNLSGATGITNEELEQKAETLEGATMPDGQKYKGWLKSRENDGKNSGPS